MFLLPGTAISPSSPDYLTFSSNLHPFSACSALLSALDTDLKDYGTSSVARWRFIRFSQWETPVGRERDQEISSQPPPSLGIVSLEVTRGLHEYSFSQVVPPSLFFLGSKDPTSFLSLWPHREITVSHFSCPFNPSLPSAYTTVRSISIWIIRAEFGFCWPPDW